MNPLTFPFRLTRELLRGIGMGCEILWPREDSRDEIVKNWPDGENPEEPRFFPGYDVYATVPQSSAGSATSEAGVAPTEQVPTPESALPQPGVGHPKNAPAPADFPSAGSGCINYPVISPLELQDAADQLLWVAATKGQRASHSSAEIHALARRLHEYALSIIKFENSQ